MTHRIAKLRATLLLAAPSLAAVSFALTSPATMAQAFPSKPIRAVSQFGSGASADIVSRIVIPYASELLGQPIVVENRPGATGAIAAETVARAAPDGYTLLLSSPSQMVRCAAGLKCTVDPLRDLTAITPIGDAPTAVFVSSSLPIQSFRELLEYAKANPNKLSYGTSGIASKSHLAAEAIQRAGAVRLVHVPYKVGNQALLDVMAGQLPVSLSISDLALPHLRAGKVKALAVLDARTQLLPGVPAVAEVIPGFIAPPSWAGFSGPANLPPPVLKRLADALTRAIKSPEATAKLNATGWEAWGHPPEEYTAMIRRDLELVARIIREAGIRIED